MSRLVRMPTINLCWFFEAFLFDAMEAVTPETRSLFYGSLCLLGFFSHLHDNNDSNPDGMVIDGNSTDRTSWHKWLDNLALLVDQPRSSATAIIVQKNAGGLPIYWVAGKDESATRESVLQLKWIFHELRAAVIENESDAVALTTRIVERSLMKNGKKMRQYQRWLQKDLDTARAKIAAEGNGTSLSLRELQLIDSGNGESITSTADVESLQYFDDLLSSDGQAELSLAAFEFRNTEHRAWLKGKVCSSGKPCVWSSIRHYVGRLGSWVKAAKAIVEVYRGDRTLLFNSNVVAFSHIEHTFELPPKTISLRDILQFIAPEVNTEQLEVRLNKLCKSEKGEFSTVFKDRWVTSQPCSYPHAEVALLEHFWLNDLAYWGPNKYIGCSKYSCYCCDSYIRLLTRGELRRPCHGNAWAQWTFPNTNLPPGAKQSLQKSVLEQLIRSVRRECLSKIMKGGKWGGRKPDSTTDITSL